MGKAKKQPVKSVVSKKKDVGNNIRTPWPSDVEYISLFNRCVVDKAHIQEIDGIIDRKIYPNKDRYETVAFTVSSLISINDLEPFRMLSDVSTANEYGQRKPGIPDLLRNLVRMEPDELPQVLLKHAKTVPFEVQAGDERRSDHSSLHIAGGYESGFRLRPPTGRLLPWYLVAVIHNMESGCNFRSHFHNGDPLSSYTTHIPKGHPLVHHPPPFAWEESATDALLTVHELNKVNHWNLPKILNTIEEYNGTGYRLRRLYTPYLWSYSNVFLKGKFVGDRVFDPEAVSRQAGAAVLLKRMEDRHLIYIPRW